MTPTIRGTVETNRPCDHPGDDVPDDVPFDCDRKLGFIKTGLAAPGDEPIVEPPPTPTTVASSADPSISARSSDASSDPSSLSGWQWFAFMAKDWARCARCKRRSSNSRTDDQLCSEESLSDEGCESIRLDIHAEDVSKNGVVIEPKDDKSEATTCVSSRGVGDMELTRESTTMEFELTRESTMMEYEEHTQATEDDLHFGLRSISQQGDCICDAAQPPLLYCRQEDASWEIGPDDYEGHQLEPHDGDSEVSSMPSSTPSEWCQIQEEKDIPQHPRLLGLKGGGCADDTQESESTDGSVDESVLSERSHSCRKLPAPPKALLARGVVGNRATAEIFEEPYPQWSSEGEAGTCYSPRSEAGTRYSPRSKAVTFYSPRSEPSEWRILVNL